MSPNSSPPLFRQSIFRQSVFKHPIPVVPNSPALPTRSRGRDFLDSDETEDLIMDNIPCSQSPRPPAYFTQPTQILSNPTLQRQTTTAPSPDPIVEVPASSPFRMKTTAPAPAGRLASAMAPAGTTFRPPQARQQTAALATKKVIEISDDDFEAPTYNGDSSDDNGPMRGDIRPFAFIQRKRPADAAFSSRSPTKPVINNPTKSFHELADARLTQMAKKVYHIMSGAYPLDKCRAALLKCDCNPGKACRYLRDEEAFSPTHHTKRDPGFELVESDTDSGELVGTVGSPATSSIASPSTSQDATTPKPPRRGRLVQGRPPRTIQPLTSSPPAPPASISAARSQIIDLVSDGEEAADFSENGSVQEIEPQGFHERVLSILNTASTQQLIAAATITEQIAQLMVDHRPYESLQDARQVSLLQRKPGKNKAKRVEVGEDVIRAIEEFLAALEGIDRIVSTCEKNGTVIKAAVSTWNVDIAGKTRSAPESRFSTPPTPQSIDEQPGRLCELPIPKEPKFMRGHCNMKTYQLYGLNWMHFLYRREFGGILADDMGLGKTCQVIALISHIVDQWDERSGEEMPWPNFIVVPPSTLANWQTEFERFAPDIKVTLYSGSQQQRDILAEEFLENPEEHHVILTSYTQLGRPEDIAAMRNLHPNVAVFDEGHKLKNPMSKLYKDLIRIVREANWRLLLTGTPVQNNLMEMIALLNFVEPDLFHEHFSDLQDLFKQKVTLRDVSNGALLYSERVVKARAILEPFILQRRKEQVLNDIPQKMSKMVVCEMDKTQESIYQEYESQFKRGKTGGGTKKRGDARGNDQNNVWVQLRKSAIHPQLFRRYFSNEKVEKMAQILMKTVPQDELRQPNLSHLIDELKNCSDFELHLWCRDYPSITQFDVEDGSWIASGKVQQLLRLVHEFEENGGRVLVFTRFAKVLEILSECFASSGISYLSLQGSTDVAERQGLIDEFNRDKSITAFLLTTAAGGTGINLTAANKVIIFDQSDNPMDDIQAENRAHRLGQEREVEVIRLISKNTIEELVYKACEKKIELANRVTGWTGEEEQEDSSMEMTSAQLEAKVRSMMHAGNVTPPGSD